MDNTDVRVSDKAILEDGVQVSWALPMYKDEYLYQCLENTPVEFDLDADAYASDEDYGEMRSLDDDDDVAWK